MLKFLVIIAVIALAIWIFKNYGRSRPPRAAPGEDMVRCMHCGVHLPKSESLVTRGAFFCSDAHRRLHQEKND